MAQTYTSNGVALHITTLAKSEHSFIKDGEKVGKFSINRSSNEIEIRLLYDDEATFKSISDCYNQFIDKNKKYSDFALSVSLREGSKFTPYAIKRDENSPIKLVTKEQIDQLDKNNIPYYNYLAPSRGLSKPYGKHKNCLTNNHLYFLMDKPDELEGTKIFLDNARGHYIEADRIFRYPMYFYLKNASDYDSNTYIKVPDVEVRNIKDSIKGIVHIVGMSEVGSINQDYRPPLDFSNMDTSNIRVISFSYNFNKENLVNTLKTMKHIPDIILNKKTIETIGINPRPKNYLELVGSMDEANYDGKKLLEALTGHKNELTNV